MSLFDPSVPEIRGPLRARLLVGANGHRIRRALTERMPLRRHARDRMSRRQRCIPAELVRIVLLYGRAQETARGIRLSLCGVDRPANITPARWEAASWLVVPLDEQGFIPTVYRDRVVR